MACWLYLLVITGVIYKGVYSHEGRLGHYTLGAKQAKTFLHPRIKRSDERCNKDEPYCETNWDSCMRHNEDSREFFCSKDNECSSGQTCYLITPCPVHYSTGCSDNPCHGLPCQNLGTCIQDAASSYRCRCMVGFDDSSDCVDLDYRAGPADVVFVLDSSHSVNRSFEQSKNVLSDIVSGLPVGENDFHFALVTYSFSSAVEFTLNTHNTTADILNSIANVQKHLPRATMTSSALQRAYQILYNSERNAYKHIILLTDGLSTDRSAAIQTAISYRNQYYRIYTVGIGNDIDQKELLDIASESGDFGGIPHVFPWTRIEDLRNVLMNQTIKSNTGECTKISNSEIMLILDATMPIDEFELAKDAMVKLIEYLDVPNTDVKIGLTSFGSQLNSEFLLNDTKCCDTCTLLTCVQGIGSLPLQTANITNALVGSSQKLSSQDTNVRKFLILFSNGTWQDTPRIKETITNLHSQNISVLTVALGNEADLVTIQTVSIDSNLIFYVDDKLEWTQLYSLKSQIFRVQCNNGIL